MNFFAGAERRRKSRAAASSQRKTQTETHETTKRKAAPRNANAGARAPAFPNNALQARDGQFWSPRPSAPSATTKQRPRRRARLCARTRSPRRARRAQRPNRDRAGARDFCGIFGAPGCPPRHERDPGRCLLRPYKPIPVYFPCPSRVPLVLVITLVTNTNHPFYVLYTTSINLPRAHADRRGPATRDLPGENQGHLPATADTYTRNHCPGITRSRRRSP